MAQSGKLKIVQLDYPYFADPESTSDEVVLKGEIKIDASELDIECKTDVEIRTAYSFHHKQKRYLMNNHE